MRMAKCYKLQFCELVPKESQGDGLIRVGAAFRLVGVGGVWGVCGGVWGVCGGCVCVGDLGGNEAVTCR